MSADGESRWARWSSPVRKGLALASLASLVWVIFLLWDTRAVVAHGLVRMETHWLLLPIFGAIAVGCLQFEAFFSLLNTFCPRVYGRKEVARLYFTGQLMKHLPGRIWGVAYQVAEGSKVRPHEWIVVSSIFMAMATGTSLWCAAVVIAWSLGAKYVATVLAIGAVLVFAGLQKKVPKKFAARLGSSRLNIARKLIEAFTSLADVPIKYRLRLVFFFIFGWLIYILSWAGYGLAWPGLRAADGYWLCAAYSLAWFVGYISFISPSGLGVREIVFVILARDYPQDAVAMLAVMGRTVLLVVDVLFAFVFMRGQNPPAIGR